MSGKSLNNKNNKNIYIYIVCFRLMTIVNTQRAIFKSGYFLKDVCFEGITF